MNLSFNYCAKILLLVTFVWSLALGAGEPLRISFSVKKEPTTFREGAAQIDSLDSHGKSLRVLKDTDELRTVIIQEHSLHPDRPWLVFIHGFNSDNQKSLERLHGLEKRFRETNLLLLEWPSGSATGLGLKAGKALLTNLTLESVVVSTHIARKYTQECMIRAKAAAKLFQEPLNVLVDAGGPNMLLGGHSMGGEVYKNLMNTPLNRKFKAVVLVAPCTNATEFESTLANLGTVGNPFVTVFCSTTDKVLGSAHLAFVKKEAGWKDERILGTGFRPRVNYDYDLINITCAYQDHRSLLAHFPSTDAKEFFDDFNRALDGNPVRDTNHHMPLSIVYQLVSCKSAGIMNGRWCLSNLMLNLGTQEGKICGKLPGHWYNFHSAKGMDWATYLKFSSPKLVETK